MARKRASKRDLAAQYRMRLKSLRTMLDGFDAKKFDVAYSSKPRTSRGKAEKAKLLAKVARTFKRARPFLHRPHKFVRVSKREHVASLKKYVGLGNFKGLRAIPVPTDSPKTFYVTFDKDGNVEERDKRSMRQPKKRRTYHRTYLLPHKPRDTDDLIAMAEALVPRLPQGMYLIATRHHFLIPTATDRDGLVRTLREFAYAYRNSLEFLLLIYGFRWIAGSYERAVQVQEFLKTERGRQKAERKRLQAEAKARVIAEMDRQFKRGRLSKRARATGRR